MKKIRFVDGSFIRNHQEVNFGILEEHATEGFAPCFFIPKNELWVDKQYRKELDFFIRVVAFYNNPRFKNTPYQKIRELMKQEIVKPGPLPPYIMKSERRGALTLRYVNGRIVREYLDPDFMFGGHDLVYSYIPKNEVWIDNLQGEKEMPYTVLHELTERAYMKKGMSYDAAHDIAIAIEKAQRRGDGVGRYPGDAGYSKKDVIPYATY